MMFFGIIFENIETNDFYFTFFETNKISKNILLGFSQKINLKSQSNKVYFINTNKLSLEEFIITDKNINYLKISASNEEILDFEEFLFWLKPNKYKQIKELTQIKKKSEIISNFSKILELLKL